MNLHLPGSIPQILLAVSTAAFTAGALAAVGQQNPPPGPNHVPDYFGITPNYATSPQPVLATVTISGDGTGAVAAATTYDYSYNVQTDKIMDVQVLNGGSGYTNATATVSGGPGATPVTLTPIIQNGVITGFSEIPKPTSSDPTFTGLGTGFKTPIAGTGIRKFVDTLPMLGLPGVPANNLGQILPIAVADTTTFPGSDYYVIAEREYTQKLHSDLPETHLRGYVQLDANGNAMGPVQYLGPIIVAQKNRPVRIKLINQLSTGAAGKLLLPVDTSYMGADNAENTDNRTALHIHGGNVPWISDGTPRQWVKPAGEVGPNKGESARNVPDMWFDASGNLINDPSCKQGTTTCEVAGATNNPGDGALTFYFGNEQSARLMFYHDHAEGITRLNVYAGIAAGYVLTDPTEQALVDDGTLPPLADTIPLVIQDKTFVPDNTKPVLNFYGPFASALNSQDPTWRWGSGSAAPGLNGNGDLWVPHIFMPNQNPGDTSGANPFGRWDYGPWFWPPFATITNPPLPNPYYDPACNVTTTYCEGPFIPGVPNGSSPAVLNGGDLTRTPPIQPLPGGVPVAEKNGAISDSPSATLEAFNDTPTVNGTAYPYITVDPKKYRLRILSVGNDRWFDLSLVVAASKKSIDTTATGNAGTTNNSILCDGTTNVDPADCTEVKMVPFDAAQNRIKPFPPHWYTLQKGGVTFDGRPSGVFDPDTRGPAMVQIATEGGFLPAPVEIKNQPVNFVYNPRNILIGNIKEHALLLGPAERADVIVDFSKFAGSTLILYNDAPAPIPAWDLRQDYFTGDYDNTDTGGAFSTIPGYGPNTRTVMQIRVSTNGGSTAHTVDDTGTIDMAALTTKLQAAFKTGQEPIIVPQAAYNPVYGTNVTDSLGVNLSRISDNQLTYTPLKDPSTGTLEPAPVTLELEPKTIIEDWTMNWGRMNALLGTEVPRTNAINQTSIPQAYVDPPTELVKLTPNDNMVPISGTLPDGTQLWKVTHNGVDSHSMHFHLFNVQLVDRIGWDGAVYPPAANELGWKDSVLMHPLSDVVVALRPMNMTLPFKVPNSHRLVYPILPVGATSPDFFNFDPLTGNLSNVTNLEVNYGWEYVWHCHILGHEENDMMRAIAVAQPPETPTALSATGGTTSVTINWTDNSIISNWVTIQRALDSNFTTGLTAFNVVVPECTSQAGCDRSYVDTTAPAETTVYYRIEANNTVGGGDGRLDAPRNPTTGAYGAALPPTVASLTPGFIGFANVTAESNWSNTVAREYVPVASVSPASLNFPVTVVGTTSSPQTVTVSNTGYAPLSISDIAVPAPFVLAPGGSCSTATPVVAGSNCTINVAFEPMAMGTATASLVITDNSGGTAGVTQSVALNGTTPMPVASLSADMLSFGDVLIGKTPYQSVTLRNTGNVSLTINSISVTGTGFTRNLGGCGTSLAAGASCTISVQFAPTTTGPATGSLVVTDNSQGTAGSQQTVTLSGTGVVPEASLSPSALDFGSVVVGTNSTQTVTVSNTGTGTLSITSLSVTGSGFTRLAGGCSNTLAAGSSCTISLRFAPTTTGPANGSLVVTDNSLGTAGSQQTVMLSGTGVVPIAAASLSSETLSFGDVLIGKKPYQSVTLLNTGNLSLTINSISVTGTGFSRVSGGCGTSLAAGASCTISVQFAPTTTGPANGSLVITDNSGGIAGSQQTVALSGNGVVPIASLSPSTLDFGSVQIGTGSTQAITVTNTGGGTLSITNLSVTGSGFTRLAGGCGSTLAAGANCSILVRFAPTTSGPATGSLVVTDNSLGTAGSQQTVTLSGTGAY